jgi:hypothetical protein
MTFRYTGKKFDSRSWRKSLRGKDVISSFASGDQQKPEYLKLDPNRISQEHNAL